MTDHVISFGLVVRPEGIDWPKAQTELRPSVGWAPKSLSLAASKPRTVDALARETLAVHRMIDWDGGLDNGFTTSTIEGGLRITCNARVFARSADAVAMAERMLARWDGWTDWANGRRGLPADVRDWLGDEYDAAERRGEILCDLTYVASG